MTNYGISLRQNTVEITHMKRLLNGFTLLEMVIVIAIVAVLASISYPVYRHHLMMVHRREAEVELLRIATFLEQYHSEHDTRLSSFLTL